MNNDTEDEEEDKETKFYCEKCKISFFIKDGTPLDDVMCPKCKTVDIFIEFDEEEDEELD